MTACTCVCVSVWGSVWESWQPSFGCKHTSLAHSHDSSVLSGEWIRGPGVSSTLYDMYYCMTCITVWLSVLETLVTLTWIINRAERNIRGEILMRFTITITFGNWGLVGREIRFTLGLHSYSEKDPTPFLAKGLCWQFLLLWTKANMDACMLTQTLSSCKPFKWSGFTLVCCRERHCPIRTCFSTGDCSDIVMYSGVQWYIEMYSDV